MSLRDSYIGINRRTERRMLLLFRRNPAAPNVCVYCDLDSMPERFLDPINAMLAEEGIDASVDLAFHLARRMLRDHNRPLLDTLHYAGLVETVPVEDVDVMDPQSKIRRPLTEVWPAPCPPPRDMEEQFRKELGEVPKPSEEKAAAASTATDALAQGADHTPAASESPKEKKPAEDDRDQRIERLERRVEEMTAMLEAFMRRFSEVAAAQPSGSNMNDG